MALIGVVEYKARLKSVRKAVGQPMAKAWAKECAKIMSERVGAMDMPYSGTGRGKYGSRDHPEYILRDSFRVKAARMGSGVVGHYTVVGSFHAYFVDHGVVAHSLQRRGKGQDRTVFARKHPGYRSRPFRTAAAVEAYRRTAVPDKIIEAWNAGA